MMFSTVLQRQVAATLLRTMAMNPDIRTNRNQSNVSQQGILYEIDGNPEGRAGGLGHELKKGYEYQYELRDEFFYFYHNS